MEQIEKRLDIYKIHRDIIKLQDSELDSCYNELSKLDELVKTYRHDNEKMKKETKIIKEKICDILEYMEREMDKSDNITDEDFSFIYKNLEEIKSEIDGYIPNDY